MAGWMNIQKNDIGRNRKVAKKLGWQRKGSNGALEGR